MTRSTGEGALEAKPPKPWPSLYTWIWPMIVAAGRRKGYAIALHGSMARDLDVIAVPWVEDAASAEDLIAEIREAVGVLLDDRQVGHPHVRSAMPHGRTAWSLPLGGGAYIDLSVTARTTEESHE